MEIAGDEPETEDPLRRDSPGHRVERRTRGRLVLAGDVFICLILLSAAHGNWNRVQGEGAPQHPDAYMFEDDNCYFVGAVAARWVLKTTTVLTHADGSACCRWICAQAGMMVERAVNIKGFVVYEALPRIARLADPLIVGVDQVPEVIITAAMDAMLVDGSSLGSWIRAAGISSFASAALGPAVALSVLSGQLRFFPVLALTGRARRDGLLTCQPPLSVWRRFVRTAVAIMFSVASVALGPAVALSVISGQLRVFHAFALTDRARRDRLLKCRHPLSVCLRFVQIAVADTAAELRKHVCTPCGKNIPVDEIIRWVRAAPSR